MDGENSKGKYERVQLTHCNDVYNTGVVHSHHQMSYLFTVVTLNCTEASCLSNKRSLAPVSNYIYTFNDPISCIIPIHIDTA